MTRSARRSGLQHVGGGRRAAGHHVQPVHVHRRLPRTTLQRDPADDGHCGAVSTSPALREVAAVASLLRRDPLAPPPGRVAVRAITRASWRRRSRTCPSRPRARARSPCGVASQQPRWNADLLRAPAVADGTGQVDVSARSMNTSHAPSTRPATSSRPASACPGVVPPGRPTRSPGIAQHPTPTRRVTLHFRRQPASPRG